MKEHIITEDTKECYISLLRGLLHFHQRSTLAGANEECSKVYGGCPKELTEDAYSEALEAAIRALEAYEERDFATGLKKGSGRASDTATGLPIIYD